MMSQLRLILEHALHYRMRTLLLVFTVMLAFFTLAVLGALRFSLNSGSDSVAERRLIIGHEAGLMQTLPMAHMDRLAAIDGVAQISHATWMGTYYREQRDMLMSFAVEPASWLDGHPEMIVTAAHRAAFLKDRRSILVAKPLADKFGWQVGQIVPLKSVMYAPPQGERAWPFVLSGTFVTDDSGGGRNYIIAHYDFFNTNRTLFKDSVGTFVVMPDVNSDAIVVASNIDAEFARSVSPTSSATDRAFHAEFFEQFGNVAEMIQLVVIVTFSSLVLVVASSMALSMRQRRKDLGVLRVIGYSHLRIMTLVFGQVALVVFAGAALGLGVGAGFNSIIVTQLPQFLPNITLPLQVLIEALLIAAAIAVITAAVPTWLALRVKPVEAFAMEQA